jgi:hypothetical protein
MATSVEHVMMLVNARQDHKYDQWQTMAAGDPSMNMMVRETYPTPLTDHEKFLSSKLLSWNAATDQFRVTAGRKTWVETTDVAEAVCVFNQTMENV